MCPQIPRRRGGRLFIDLGGRANLFDLSFAEDRDAVAHRQGFLLIVSNKNKGNSHPLLNGLKLDLHLLAQFEVERAERLIEQQNFGMIDQARGQERRAAFVHRRAAKACDIQSRAGERDRAFRPLACKLRFWHPFDHQTVGDIVFNVM